MADSGPRPGKIPANYKGVGANAAYKVEPFQIGTYARLYPAFDGMATTALQLFTGRPLTAGIVPPEDQAVHPGEAARYRLSQGRIERVR